MPRLWYWQIQTKGPEILSCSKLKKKDLHRQKHTITHTGNLGKMEHSWSACLGSFAHSSPHIGKLHDGQQYSPVTGLRKMLVSQTFLTFPDFFGHLRHVRQQGVVLCLGPIAAGWSDSTLSGLFQTQINHFLITFYSVSLTLSFSLSFSVTFSLSHQFERFDIATSFEISAKSRIVGHLKARCHDGWLTGSESGHRGL